MSPLEIKTCDLYRTCFFIHKIMNGKNYVNVVLCWAKGVRILFKELICIGNSTSSTDLLVSVVISDVFYVKIGP